MCRVRSCARNAYSRSSADQVALWRRRCRLCVGVWRWGPQGALEPWKTYPAKPTPGRPAVQSNTDPGGFILGVFFVLLFFSAGQPGQRSPAPPFPAGMEGMTLGPCHRLSGSAEISVGRRRSLWPSAPLPTKFRRAASVDHRRARAKEVGPQDRRRVHLLVCCMPLLSALFRSLLDCYLPLRCPPRSLRRARMARREPQTESHGLHLASLQCVSLGVASSAAPIARGTRGRPHLMNMCVYICIYVYIYIYIYIHPYI